MRVLRILLWLAGGLVGLFGLLVFGVMMLAFAGILADVGPDENRKMAFELMWLGVAAAAASIVILLVAWRLPGRKSAQKGV